MFFNKLLKIIYKKHTWLCHYIIIMSFIYLIDYHFDQQNKYVKLNIIHSHGPLITSNAIVFPYAIIHFTNLISVTI